MGFYSDGETATIQIAGAVDDAQSGLTPGQQHYVQMMVHFLQLLILHQYRQEQVDNCCCYKVDCKGIILTLPTQQINSLN